MSMSYPRTFRTQQRGAAMIIIFVILVTGAITFLVSALNSSALRLSRQDVTALALAQARDALIGRAVADADSPGSLPCPDTDDDGIAESVLLSGDCPSYIGRLPWMSLGLPDLRDGAGERLWYAFSTPFRDALAFNPVNSDSVGDLTITGSTSASAVVAIVFAPGDVLSGQTRSSTQTALCATSNTNIAESLCAENYLEGTNANVNLYTAPNTAYESNVTSDTFNDQLIHLTHDQLFAPVEIRIAREVRSCLDTYALANGNKYPWATPVTDAGYTGTYNTFFGRIPTTPNVNTSSGASSAAAITLTSALNALQAALDTFYLDTANAANKLALYNAGLYVISLKSSIPTLTPVIDTAGDWGRDIGNGSEASSAPNYVLASGDIGVALTDLAAYSATTDPSMTAAWPSGCVMTGSYWGSWRELVYYQVASGFQPGIVTPSCISCLSITGTGNTAGGNGSYRVAIAIARAPLGTQVRAWADSTTYLEGLNQHQATLTTTFETHQPSAAGYLSVNDLVLCVDGKNNCI